VTSSGSPDAAPDTQNEATRDVIGRRHGSDVFGSRDDLDVSGKEGEEATREQPKREAKSPDER
jgi:hypothetical protein